MAGGAGGAVAVDGWIAGAAAAIANTSNVDAGMTQLEKAVGNAEVVCR